MLSSRWIGTRREHWSRLETLLLQGRRNGIGSLSHAHLQELGLLYRQTASDLAFLRESETDRRFERYLNQLLGEAHNFLYRNRVSRREGIWSFLWNGFPVVFRETFSYTFAAFTLFAVAAVVGMLLSLFDPTFNRYMLGPGMIDTLDRGEMWTHSIVTIKPVASSAIMTNNLMVGFFTFASGVLAGLGTVYSLLLNGLLIGTVATACQESGLGLQLWSFVAPHGVLELPAIFMAGGAGLLLGRAVLFPGVLARRDSLVYHGGKAVRLVLGTIPILVIAGIIEGFVSPTQLPPPLKFLLAGIVAILLFAYLTKPVPRSPAAES